MTYKRFEDLPVWQAGLELAVRVANLTDDRAFHEAGDLPDQLRRSSESVPDNIAEGFERGTTPELLMFLYIARGSAGECRSQLRFCLRRSRFKHLYPEIESLIPLAESCSRQIRAWTESLQNSDIKGPRHLNDEVREAFDRKRRANAFREKLKAMNAHLYPKNEEQPA
jgi:four helix bundle protein